MKTEPSREHAWLQQLTGRWRMTADMGASTAPSPPEDAWHEEVRSLGGLWIVAEGKGEMPEGDGPGTTIMSLGYDPEKKHYIGTFIGSMMTHLWIYEGSLDETGKVLTLDCVGPDFETAGRMTRYQDIITLKDADRRTLTSRMQAADGTWKQVMTANYTRMPD